MEDSLFELTDRWLTTEGPEGSVVVSCRARYARNLAGRPFPPRARGAALRKVAETVSQAVEACEELTNYHRLVIEAFPKRDRLRLRESQMISQEMERGGKHRLVFVGDDPVTAIMVNEEDHMRIFVIMPGLQMEATFEALARVEATLAKRLRFAFSEQFGYLAACPTNVGTGLRVSAMLHLPGLTIAGDVADLMNSIPNYGLAVRGYYGENSEHLGDFYQISNETTLGENEEQIIARLTDRVREVVDRERDARSRLFAEQRDQVEDRVYRALSVLSSARLMATREAVQLLSVLRLGIDSGLAPMLKHTDISRLIVLVQPAHLQHLHGEALEAEQRDIVRADMLRRAFADLLSSN